MASSSNRIVRIAFAAAVAAAVACGGDSTGPGGGTGSGDSRMTARIDGAQWASDAIYVESGVQSVVPGLYVISGTRVTGSTATGITITLSDIKGPGTYPLGTGGGVSGGSGIVVESPAGWGTPLSGAAGTITITTLTSSRISGTFEFTAVASTGGATGTRVVSDGRFDLDVVTQGTVAPLPDQAGGRVSAQIGGEAWNAATIALQPLPATVWGFAASNNEHLISLALQGVDGPGNYELSNTVPLRFAEVKGPGDAPNTGACCWTSTLGGATGSLTIDTWTGTRATGTFAFTLSPADGSAATEPIVVAGGTFDVGIPQVQ